MLSVEKKKLFHKVLLLTTGTTICPLFLKFFTQDIVILEQNNTFFSNILFLGCILKFKNRNITHKHKKKPSISWYASIPNTLYLYSHAPHNDISVNKRPHMTVAPYNYITY